VLLVCWPLNVLIQNDTLLCHHQHWQDEEDTSRGFYILHSSPGAISNLVINDIVACLYINQYE